MQFGAGMFFTAHSVSATELAIALEQRGFESRWAPEHSHIPLSPQSTFPQGGPLPRKYGEAMDPFVTLAVAAAATRRLNIGTGVCRVTQRDVIETAKRVASIDQLSNGRFLFGIGGGWNAEELADHGTTDFKHRFQLMRKRVAAMQSIWTEESPAYHGKLVNFGPMMCWPKPVQKPYPLVTVGGAFSQGARRAIRYAMAGSRPARVRNTKLSAPFCRRSGRWHGQRAAIRRRCR